ncbi:hypothetical protein [Sphingomonas cavernae]|nr:hypothetical protein [Sphingomonas cavernae]
MRIQNTPKGNAMLQPQTTTRPHTRRLEHPLLASCAIGLALVALARAPQAHAQAFNGTVINQTGANVTTATAGRTDIQVTASRAVIDWAPTPTPGPGPIEFQAAARPAVPTDGAYFRGSGDFTILNRILPTGPDAGRAIALNGRVVSEIQFGSGPITTGGNVWFYSPGGIAIGANATFDVGSLLLSTLDVADADFLDANDNNYNFGFDPATIIGTSAVTIASGATINALNENSYVAMIAPRVVQGGNVNVNGTATYVAAEQTTINMAGGLFAIDITTGTTDANGIVHTGTTTGPGSLGGGDTHTVTLMAVPKNSAITMLVGGDLGYGAAGAGIINGTVELYAGYDLPDGSSPTADNGGFASDIVMSGGIDLSSDLTARASRDVSLVANSSGTAVSTGNVTLLADRNAIVTANALMTIAGGLSVVGNNAGLGGIARVAVGSDGASTGAFSVANDLEIDASVFGLGGSSSITAGTAEFLIDAGSASVGLSTFVEADAFTGPTDNDAIGGTARVAVTGGSVNLGDLTLSADARGSAIMFGTGAGTGGLAEIVQSGGTFTAASLRASANGNGGDHEMAPPGGGGVAGTGTGGIARVNSIGGTLRTGSIDLEAEGIGGFGAFSDANTASAGGAALGGTARLSITGGAVITDSVTIAASASGGRGGSSFEGAGAVGGAGVGGIAELIVSGGQLRPTDITMPMGAIRIDADGNGGNGGSTLVAGTPANGGVGLGGTARFSFTNFGFLIADNAEIWARGRGGRGGEFGYGAGQGADGGDGFGGGAFLDLAAGLTLGSLVIDASGFGGDGGFAQIGGAGGDGYGGISTNGGGANLDHSFGTLAVATVDVLSNGAGGAGGFSFDGRGGDGGSGTGGDTRVRVDSSQAFFTASDLVSSVAPEFRFTANGVGGAANYGNTASGPGAAGGDGGNGTGGTVSFDVLNGARLRAAGVMQISAEGIAADGALGAFGTTGGIGGAGGDAFGGTALVTIDGGIVDAIAPPAWTVSAAATGGAGGNGGDGSDPGNSGGTGGNGGTARAGNASFTANNADLSLSPSAMTVDAVGTGGNGGVGGNGVAAGNGGDGFGGIARFANADNGVAPVTPRNVGDVVLGSGGNGGLAGGAASGQGFAGRVEIANAPSSASGSINLASLDISNNGIVSAGSGVSVTSSGGALTVTNGASIDTDGSVAFSFSGNGRLSVGGTLLTTARGDISITHSGQPATPVDSISAASLRFSTPGNFNADAGSVLRSTSSILISANGNISAGNLFALNRISAYAGGNLSLGNAGVTAVVSPPFGGAPTNGVIDLLAGYGSNGFVPANLTLTGNISATGHISAQAGGDIVVASGANVISDNRITFRSGDDILVRAGALVRAAANPLPESGYGVSGPLDEPALLDFNAGAIAVTPTVPGNVAAIIVDGTIGAPDRAVTLTAGAIQADANAISSKNFYASLLGVPATGSPADNDGGQLRADCVAGNICLGALGASNIVRIGPESGSVDVPNRISLAGNIAGGDIVIRARDGIAFNGPAAINATDRLFVAVLNGDLTGSGGFTLSGDDIVNVYAGGNIVAPQGSIAAAGDLGLFAGGNLSLGTIDTGGLLRQIDADGAVTRPDGLTVAGSIAIANQFAVRGGDARLDAGSGIDVANALVGDGSDIAFTTTSGTVRLGAAGQPGLGNPANIALSGGTVALGALAASGDVTLNATGAVNGTDIDAGGALTVNAGGGTSFATLGAANGITIQSGGAVVVSTDITSPGAIRVTGTSLSLSALGDLTVADGQASAGNLSFNAGGALNAIVTRASGSIALGAGTNLAVGGADAGGNFTATAQGRTDFTGIVAANSVTVSSNDIGIGAGGQLGVIGRTATVSLTNSSAARQTHIGGADTSAGYSLSAIEIGRIFGDSIGVTAPRVATLSPTSVGSSRAPDVIVGAFTLTGRAGGTSGNLGSGALRIITPGKLRVNGAVQLTGLTTTNRFEINATDALEIDAATGMINLRDASNGLGGVLQLTSDDIIAASLQAIADVGAASTTDAIDDRLGRNDGAVSDDGYLSANRIEVNVLGGFYVQNSGASDDFADRRGFTVGTGGIDITTGSAATRIVINGQQSDGAGDFVAGADMIDLVNINGQTGLAVTGIDRRSTINGCLIANPICSGFVVPDALLSREVFESPVDPESADEALQQLFPLTLIELKEFEPFGFEPLIDEPVTGAGNDDLWLPGCDPSIEQCAAPPQQ